MEQSIVLAFCTYSSITTVVRLSKGATYGYLLGILTNRFPDLSNLDLRISYSVSGYQTILLENDVDVDIMIDHCFRNRLSRVDVVVVPKSLVPCNVVADQANVNVPLLPDMSHSAVGSVSSLRSTSSTEVEIFSDRWSNALREVGQIFKGGPQEFRLALIKYAVEKGFNYVFKKNDSDRVTAKCKVDFCTWMIHARYDGVGGDFFIKKWKNHHDCNGGLRTVTHKRVSSKLVANLFEKHVRSDPAMKPIKIKASMKLLYGLNVSYHNAWKGKEMALDDVQGDERLAFDRMRAYEHALLSTNPGSVTSLEYDHSSGRFQRFFLALAGCIEGFQHCRPLLFLDGTFLKGKYKGTLLCATGKNGQKGMYPLCCGVVDVENERNWVWFAQKMAEILDPQRTIVFVSDRNKGLLEAISIVFPGSPHAFCIEHLKQNLRTKISVYKGNKFREMLVAMFERVARARTEKDFAENMSLFKAEGGRYVEKFIEGLPTIHWANAYFPGCRYGEMNSNMAESFNSWILEERALPIDVMVDQIRLRLMELMSDRLREASSWRTFLCPIREKKLQDNMIVACSFQVTRSTDSIYEVHSTPKYVVDLATRSCLCREWDVEGFPCPHALAAIQYNKENVYTYCERYFTTSAFIASYSNPIFPVTVDHDMNGSDNEVLIKAPAMRRPPGRPKRKRCEPSVGQNKKTIRCTRCGKVGNHNRRSCKEPILG